MRAPVGGLFRHVHDLALGQAELGADVGIVCDSTAGGPESDVALHRLQDCCKLGVTRIPMAPKPHVSDWSVYRRIAKLGRSMEIDVLHGHGTKGGAYARLAGKKLRKKKTKVVYTPHGGLVHYSPSSVSGKLHFWWERRLAPLTHGLIFESMFAGNRYAELVGRPTCPARVIYNGLQRLEFYESLLADDAVDFVYVGELRKAKGVDVFLRALAQQQSASPARAIIVGSGPDEKHLKRLARRLGLADKVAFAGSQPARTAFVRARCVVIPAREESLPYIVIEAAAAQMPIIATSAGGIPEITGDISIPLVPPGDVDALATQLQAFLADSGPYLRHAVELQQHVADVFSTVMMTREVVDFYITDVGAGAHRAPPADV